MNERVEACVRGVVFIGDDRGVLGPGAMAAMLILTAMMLCTHFND